MKKIQLATQLPGANKTPGQKSKPLSITSGSHGNQTNSRSKISRRFAAAIALCSLLSALWIACEQPDSGNSNNNNGDAVTFADFSFAPETTSFILRFDKNIEGLSAEDITLTIRDGSGAADESFTPALLSGPDAEHRYTLAGRFTGNGADGKSATATVTKEGFTFNNNARSAAIEFLTVSLMSITVDPDTATSTKTTKLIFEFDRDVPNFGEDDINIFQRSQTDPVVLTRKLSGMERGDGENGNVIYELPVRCMGSLVSPGIYAQTLTITPNGYKFLYTLNGAFLGNNRVFRVYYAASPVSGVSITPSPESAVISDESWSSPKEWTLTAVVSYTDRDDRAAAFSLENAPLTGVTLTDNGNGTAALSIAGTVTAGVVTVLATANEDDEKTATFQVVIEKNADPVANDAAFDTAISGAGNLIIIASAINTPAEAPVMESAKTIEIRDGGTLTVADAFTAKGTIKVKSGGKIEIAGGKTLTVDSTTSSTIKFDDVVFPAGTYNSYAGKKVTLAYDGTAKSVSIGGDGTAVLTVTPNPAGTSGAPKYINFPTTYSLVLVKDVFVVIANYAVFNFGSSSGYGVAVGKTFVAQTGNAVLSAIGNGVVFKTTVSGGSLMALGESFYCGVGKEVQFPASGNGYYPLTYINSNGLSTTTAAVGTPYYTISSAGNVKMSVTGGDAVISFASNAIKQTVLTVLDTIQIAPISESSSANMWTLNIASGTVGLTVSEFDLNGVGTIELNKNAGLRVVKNSSVITQIKTGNTQGSDTDRAFVTTGITLANSPVIRGTGTSGSGLLASIAVNASYSNSTLTNTNDAAFAINAATQVQ